MSGKSKPTLSEFLLARYDETEAYATAYVANAGPAVDFMRADFESKRRIVEWCGVRDKIWMGSGWPGGGIGRSNDFADGELKHPADSVVLRLLALPYVNHAEYDESWRP